MTDLADRPILNYRDSETPLSEKEIKEFLAELPGWNIVEREGMSRLEKSYAFGNFREAMDFTNLIADLAEKNDHHPAILVSSKQTVVSWWTHFFKRLHPNDFIMAAKTEVLFQNMS